jgi:hypothetical protein
MRAMRRAGSTNFDFESTEEPSLYGGVDAGFFFAYVLANVSGAAYLGRDWAQTVLNACGSVWFTGRMADKVWVR